MWLRSRSRRWDICSGNSGADTRSEDRIDIKSESRTDTRRDNRL